MLSKEILLEYMTPRLKPKRLTHCLGVAETAQALAKRYGADEQRAYIAGLGHDIAKYMTDEEYLAYAKGLGYEPDAIEAIRPGLLHARVGEGLLRELGETDEAVLQAVRLHISGAPGMTVLDACVCLADWIEPSRDFPDVPQLRIMAQTSLWRTLMTALGTTIQHVIGLGKAVHPNSVYTYNAICLQLRKEENDEGI